MSILNKVKQRFDSTKEELLTLDAYLGLLKTDNTIIENPAERMLRAIGEPKIIDTAKDSRLGRIFSNRSIRVYETFEDFYGMEDVIDQIVSFFKHAAQGLEEKKQVLYLLGPVGSAKSSLAERLKRLMEQNPIYVLKAGKTVSPVFESPLGLFKKTDSEELGIDSRYLNEHLSPWAIKRLKEFDGDISKFTVAKLYPSIDNQISIAKTEPGDENTQDISTLVGKVDIRKLGIFSENDADAYSYSGGLCLSNQGLLEFVEMFKAPIKVLNPLLTATQEGNYNGTEAISSLPFEGIVLAHSNESEWQLFRNDKRNEAFLDRITLVKVPYCLRITEELKIYKKLLRNSSLRNAPCAPETLEIMAKFAVLSRLKVPENSELHSKMLVYDGENMKEKDVKAKSVTEYRDAAGVDEGMSGISTRFSYKILSKVFNYDSTEIAANPLHLFYILQKQIEKEQFTKDVQDRYLSFLKGYLTEKYIRNLEKEIQTAYLETYDELGQNLFNRYLKFADLWIQDQDYRDTDTGELLDRRLLNEELEKIEKTAEIANPKDFRHEVVNFCLRAKAANNGRDVNWKSYNKLKTVIEKTMFSKTEDLLPIISFNTQDNKEDKVKHKEFVTRMTERGYTEKQVKVLVEWFIRQRKSL